MNPSFNKPFVKASMVFIGLIIISFNMFFENKERDELGFSIAINWANAISEIEYHSNYAGADFVNVGFKMAVEDYDDRLMVKIRTSLLRLYCDQIKVDLELNYVNVTIKDTSDTNPQIVSNYTFSGNKCV